MSVQNKPLFDNQNDFFYNIKDDGYTLLEKTENNLTISIDKTTHFPSKKIAELREITATRVEQDSSTVMKTSQAFSQNVTNQQQPSPLCGTSSTGDERNFKASSATHQETAEIKRIEIAKLVISRRSAEMYDASEFFNFINLIQLNDTSKLELLRFCAQAPSTKENVNLIETLPLFKSPQIIFQFFSDKNSAMEALGVMAEYVLRNPNASLRESFTKKLDNSEVGHLIFESHPKFFAYLANMFYSEKLFASLVEELKDAHLEYLCAEEPALIFQNMNRWSANPLDTLDKRLELASLCFEKDPEVFAKHLLNVFTEEELLENSPFFDPKIERCFSKLNDEDSKYLLKINLYLQRFKAGRTDDKDCKHWDCIGEFPEGSGIWSFKLKWTYNAGSEARAVKSLTRTTTSDNDLIFPATEPTLSALDPKLFSLLPALHRLGYEYQIGPSGVFFSFPDRMALTKNWQQLRLDPEYENLPPLSFAPSEGIATTQDFVELLGVYDVVISNNREFVHDVFNHAFPTVIAILASYLLSSPTGDPYLESVARMRAIGRKTMETIEKARGIYTAPKEIATLNLIGESLGVLYDIVTAIPEIDNRVKTLNSWETGQFFEEVYGSELYLSSTPPGFLANLWKSDQFREDLIQLGVPRDAPLEQLSVYTPTPILKKMWEQIYPTTSE